MLDSQDKKPGELAGASDVRTGFFAAAGGLLRGKR